MINLNLRDFNKVNFKHKWNFRKFGVWLKTIRSVLEIGYVCYIMCSLQSAALNLKLILTLLQMYNSQKSEGSKYNTKKNNLKMGKKMETMHCKYK